MSKIMKILLSLLVSSLVVGCSHTPNITSVDAFSTEMNMAVAQLKDVTILDESFDITNDIGTYSFTIDGVLCSLMIKKEGFEDISNKSLFDAREYEVHSIENDDLKAYRWFTVDGQYIFIAEDQGAWDYLQFNDIQKQFFDVAPMNWTSTTPYDEINHALGTYSYGDNEYFASVSLKYDQLTIQVIKVLKEGSLVLEVEGALEDGAVHYNNGTVSKVVYDESEGSSSTKELYKLNEGQVYISSDTLDLSDVTSDDFKGIVLSKV